MTDVITLGEVLIDFTPAGISAGSHPLFEQNPGGAPANVAAALARLGASVKFIGKVGEDEFGRFLGRTLHQSGIDTTALRTTAVTGTTLAFVHLNEEGDRRFQFIRNPGADTLLREDEIDDTALEGYRIFHFGSLSMTHEPSASATRKAARLASERGAIISFDPNLRIPLWDSLVRAKTVMEEGLAIADVVKISEEELDFLTGTTDLADGTKQLTELFGIKVILVTLAERGCFVRSGGISVTVPGFSVEVLDTTGAGDAFLGAFLFRLLQRECRFEELNEAALFADVRFANAVGALTTKKKGAIPAMPSKSEIEELLR